MGRVWLAQLDPAPMQILVLAFTLLPHEVQRCRVGPSPPTD